MNKNNENLTTLNPKDFNFIPHCSFNEFRKDTLAFAKIAKSKEQSLFSYVYKNNKSSQSIIRLIQNNFLSHLPFEEREIKVFSGIDLLLRSFFDIYKKNYKVDYEMFLDKKHKVAFGTMFLKSKYTSSYADFFYSNNTLYLSQCFNHWFMKYQPNIVSSIYKTVFPFGIKLDNNQKLYSNLVLKYAELSLNFESTSLDKNNEVIKINLTKLNKYISSLKEKVFSVVFNKEQEKALIKLVLKQILFLQKQDKDIKQTTLSVLENMVENFKQKIKFEISQFKKELLEQINLQFEKQELCSLMEKQPNPLEEKENLHFKQEQIELVEKFLPSSIWKEDKSIIMPQTLLLNKNILKELV